MSDFTLNDVNYKFIRNLSSGGTSSVRIYFEEKEMRKVCIKFIKKDISDSDISNEVEALERVAKIEGLKTKVPQIYNHGPLTGTVAKRYKYAIVTNQIKGKELHSAFSKMKKEEKVKVFKELVDLVCLLHLNNIIHTDIKLENIIYHKKGIALIDFGSSQVIPDDAEGILVNAKTYITTFHISPIEFLIEKYFDDEEDESSSEDDVETSRSSSPSTSKGHKKTFLLKKSFDVWSVCVCYAILFGHPEPVYKKKPKNDSYFYLYEKEYNPFIYFTEHENSPYYSILEKVFIEEVDDRPDIFEINDIINS